MYTGLHVKYLLFLSHLEKNINFLDRFSKNNPISPSSGSLIVAYGWTDKMELKVTLCNSVNVLKMCNSIYYYLSSISREFQCKPFDSQNIDCVVETNKITTILRFITTSSSCQTGWCRWSRGRLRNGQCTWWADPIPGILACKSKYTIHY